MKFKWLLNENEVMFDFCRDMIDLGDEKFNEREKLNFIEVWIILFLYM